MLSLKGFVLGRVAPIKPNDCIDTNRSLEKKNTTGVLETGLSTTVYIWVVMDAGCEITGHVLRKWSRRLPMSGCICSNNDDSLHDDVIKWKHFPHYWPFVRGIHRSPVNSPHKGQWRGALMFSLICVGINGWVNNRAAGDLRRYRTHHDVSVMSSGARFTNMG